MDGWDWDGLGDITFWRQETAFQYSALPSLLSSARSWISEGGCRLPGVHAYIPGVLDLDGVCVAFFSCSQILIVHSSSIKRIYFSLPISLIPRNSHQHHQSK